MCNIIKYINYNKINFFYFILFYFIFTNYNINKIKMFVKDFIKVFIILLIIDLIWIQLFAKNKYKKMIKNIQHEDLQIKIIPSILVYVFLTLLFIIFRNKSNIIMFLLGFLSYGVYDMTNYALLNKFDINFALFDMIWGGLLFLITNKIVLFFEKK